MITRGPGKRAASGTKEGITASRANSRAREAAIDASYARYIILTCGCYTDHETADIFRAWAPSPVEVWCEKHNRWTRPAPKRKRPVLPDTPLF